MLNVTNQKKNFQEICIKIFKTVKMARKHLENGFRFLYENANNSKVVDNWMTKKMSFSMLVNKGFCIYDWKIGAVLL